MYTARTGLIAHLDANKATIGLETVKAYAGEIRQAISNPTHLTTLLPAALVLLSEGSRANGHGAYTIDLLVVQHTQALQLQTGAGDALALVEALLDWLDANFSWQHAGRHYSIDLNDGVPVTTLMVDATFTVLQLVLQLKEL